jgi:hypothetical protein
MSKTSDSCWVYYVGPLIGSAEYTFETRDGEGPFVTRDDAIVAARGEARPGDRVVTALRTVVREAPVGCLVDVFDAIDAWDGDDWHEDAVGNWQGRATRVAGDLQARIDAAWAAWIDEHGLREEMVRVSNIKEWIP